MNSNQPTLDLNDLRILREIVSQCAQRGAFKAEEFTTVGNVYDKLTSFLEASGALESNETQASDEDSTSIENTPLSDETQAPVSSEGSGNHD